MIGSVDQRVGNVGGFERIVGAAIGQEAAFARGIDDRDQTAGLAAGIGGQMRLDAGAAQ